MEPLRPSIDEIKKLKVEKSGRIRSLSKLLAVLWKGNKCDYASLDHTY